VKNPLGFLIEGIDMSEINTEWKTIHIENHRAPYSDFIDLLICPWCSTVVADQNQHARWHIDMGHRIDDAGSMYLRRIG
jgi:hypothetical protein